VEEDYFILAHLLNLFYDSATLTYVCRLTSGLTFEKEASHEAHADQGLYPYRLLVPKHSSNGCLPQGIIHFAS
jgi:hypothetical protein